MLIKIYTDGACSGNPGKGGYGTILIAEDDNGKIHKKELTQGYKVTTNNRMEMIAAIYALEKLKESCLVKLYTDSQYLRNAVEKQWLVFWEKNNWKTANKKPVKNQDLWKRLQLQLERHNVIFTWVRGHSGHIENERCDTLARMEASRPNLPKDCGFIDES